MNQFCKPQQTMKQEGNKSLLDLLPQEYFWKKEKKQQIRQTYKKCFKDHRQEGLLDS